MEVKEAIATESMLLAASDVAIGAAGGERKLPGISMLAYGGGIMFVSGWGDVAIDLAGLDAGGQIPLLADHDARVGGVVGHGAAVVRDGRLVVTGTSNWLRINGGYIAVNANGDGIDVNGSITMTGGTVIVHGPTADNNSAIDYDTTFTISGGFLVAAGSAGMAQAPSTGSTQGSVKITYSSAKAAGTLAHIQTSSGGTDILTFAPAKTYRSLVFSAPTLTAGASFTLWRGGTCTGTVLDGLYSGGTYSGGTQTNTFTTTNIVTNVSAP